MVLNSIFTFEDSGLHIKFNYEIAFEDMKNDLSEISGKYLSLENKTRELLKNIYGLEMEQDEHE